MQSRGVAATIKHFAANSTEFARLKSDSRVSARALREIYMRAFERVVKDADPWSIMTSYNYINGVKVPEDARICEDVIRGDFGYRGMLMTDFGNDSAHAKELAAGHDLKMPFGDVNAVTAALADGTLSREKVRECAARVLELVARTAGKRMELD